MKYTISLRTGEMVRRLRFDDEDTATGVYLMLSSLMDAVNSGQDFEIDFSRQVEPIG